MKSALSQTFYQASHFKHFSASFPVQDRTNRRCKSLKKLFISRKKNFTQCTKKYILFCSFLGTFKPPIMELISRSKTLSPGVSTAASRGWDGGRTGCTETLYSAGTDLESRPGRSSPAEGAAPGNRASRRTSRRAT